MSSARDNPILRDIFSTSNFEWGAEPLAGAQASSPRRSPRRPSAAAVLDVIQTGGAIGVTAGTSGGGASSGAMGASLDDLTSSSRAGSRFGVRDIAGAVSAAREAVENSSRVTSLICRALGEDEDTSSVGETVRVIGAHAAAELFAACVEKESAGGELTADGARRRTPGGVFFSLLKAVASKAQMKEIFRDREKAHTKKVNERRRIAGGRDRMRF